MISRSILLTFFLTFSLSAENTGYIWHKTPLARAAKKADIKEMKELINQGEDVNAVIGQDQPHAGKPILRYAIDSGSLEAVTLLLDNGANLNVDTESPIITDDLSKDANIRNLSLLSHAINSHASVDIIKELIKYGANVDGKPKIVGDWSSVMVAAYRGNKEALIILLEAGADVFAVNKQDDKTALDYAREMNHREIVEILEAFYS